MYGFAFTLGCTVGFEFIDQAFDGGGWILHFFFVKLMHFEAESGE